MISTIGRPVDFRYPTNKAIAIIALAVMVLGFAFQPGALSEKLRFGFYAGATTFITWAIARELDPDHPLAAFAGSAIAVAAMVATSPPTLLLPFWALLTLRIVNRSTGAKAEIIDTIIVAGLALWLAWDHWIIGPIAAIAFALDAYLPEKHPRQWIAAAVMAAMALTRLPEFVLVSQGEYALLGLVAIATLLLVLTTKVQSVGDRDGLPLRTDRVQWTGALAFAAVALLIFSGQTIAAMPLWAAILGAGGWRMGQFIRALPRS